MKKADMATAEQIKSLIKSHFSDDMERFYTIALQVAAHEARLGHNSLALEIRDIVDRERGRKNVKVIPFPKDLKGLVITESSETPLSSLVLPEDLQERVKRIIHEYRQQSKLKSHGLDHRRKTLLIGSPGTGKTMTAKALAKELHIPLHTIQVDRLVTRFMGETAAKLRLVFDLIREEHGVYLFDEFDAIGGERSMSNDVGEMRRVLNAFLQFIEQDKSDSLIIAATNTPKILDRALYRRFDDILYYEKPGSEELKQLISNILGTFLTSQFSWKQVLKESEGLSQAEVDYACRDAVKTAILSNRIKVDASHLIPTLKERHKSIQGMRR